MQATTVPHKFLVIIDMQPRFSASRNTKLIRNIVNQIKRAKADYSDIIVLEYEPDTSCCSTADRTNHQIIRAIGDYEKCYFLIKKRDDGGPEVCTFLSQRFPATAVKNSVFQVVGVNATACVLYTVKGISSKLPDAKIEVLKNCVRDYDGPVTVDYYRTKMPANAVVI